MRQAIYKLPMPCLETLYAFLIYSLCFIVYNRNEKEGKNVEERVREKEIKD